LKKPEPSPDAGRRILRIAVGTYRLGIVFAAFACLRSLPSKQAQADPAGILAEAREKLPSAVSIGDPSDGMFPLLDASGGILGWATTTYPQASKIQGYSGPSELLVIFDSARTVRSVSLIASSDTAGHVAKILNDTPFWEQWAGKSEAALGAGPPPRMVTGASLTSEAMARGLAARFGAEGMDQWFPEEIPLASLATWFPGATRMEPLPDPGTYQVWKNKNQLGILLRSSRMGVSARGFNGTSDVIVGLDPTGEIILGVGLPNSRDNEPYVSDVKDELKYADGFAGKSVGEIQAGAEEDSSNLIVSGASNTASAVIASVREMLRRHQTDIGKQGFPWRTGIALSWIALGLAVGLGKWGKSRRVRLAYAVVSIVAGITLGWLVSQDQLVGWARNGLDLRAALPLLVLSAVALVVPAYTGKNLYCSRICPHGAAQTLLGQAVKRRFALPPPLHRIWKRVPWLTLMVIWAIALLGTGFPLAHAEPFETWSSGFQALLPTLIFTTGLLAAFFLPQAYCHYGCPTGALLRFLTHAPGRWTAKDSLAAVLVTLSFLFVHFR
jgi:NosR/NirI family nitrous oxide reductase transcriptional regulator